MLTHEFEPVARADRLVSVWQRLILALLIALMLGIAAAAAVIAVRFGVPFDALPPYTVTGLPVGAA